MPVISRKNTPNNRIIDADSNTLLVESSKSSRQQDLFVRLSSQAQSTNNGQNQNLQVQPNKSTSHQPESLANQKPAEFHSEAFILSSFYSKSNKALALVSHEADKTDDGICSLKTTSRLSEVLKLEVAERALTCSQVDEYNYRQLVKNVYKRNRLNIEQIEILDSDSLVVFSTVDLICDRFNCTKLTVFNVTGQEVQDYNVLSSRIGSWTNLEVLDLSNTALISIESILSPNTRRTPILRNLTTLLLDNNSISELNFDFILKRMPNLKHLSVTNNAIFNITCSESLWPQVKRQFETISLAGNAINCDKSQLWLMEQFQSPMANLKFPDYDQIKCAAPEKLNDMTWIQRLSVLETRICDDCDCRSLKKTAISVDCHNKNLTTLPDVLPLNTKILNLTSNRIHSIGVPHNSKNWENVTYVYLENNLITTFQPLEINSKFMRNLAALDIRRNKFREFQSHIFEQFINLDQVHLSNNPWLCDCESTFAFQEWLQRQFHKVGDKEEIICGISGSEENGVRSSSLQQRLSSRVIYRLSKSELCPQENLEEPYDWLDVVNFVLGMTILLILSKVILDYIYLHRTKRLPHFFKLNF